MSYTTSDLEDVLTEYGEVHVVLESDRQYVLHPMDTEFDHDSGEVRTRGIREGGDDYLRVVFPAEAVEHYYAHDEL